jgi:hypothetical protein
VLCHMGSSDIGSPVAQCTFAGTSWSMDALVASMRDYVIRHGGTLRHRDRAGQPPSRRRPGRRDRRGPRPVLAFAARLHPAGPWRSSTRTRLASGSPCLSTST